MISNENKDLRVSQGTKAHGLRDLRRLVHDTEVERALAEQGVVYSKTRGRHYRLQTRTDWF